MDNTDKSWTIIATYSSIEEAEIVRGLLESNGIPTVINNATIASVYPMTDSWTPLQLMIPAACREDAEKLLHH